MRKQWDLKEFDKINLPTVVNVIGQSFVMDPTEFSKPRGIRLLDMAIYMPGQHFKVPEFIAPYRNVIGACLGSEYKDDPNFLNDHYIYITLDQKIVQKGQTGRRAGAHSDAFISTGLGQVDITLENKDLIAKETGEVSHTYIMSDCAPTEFFRAKFPITADDCETSLKTFDEIAETAEAVKYPSYTLLKLDPYVVHRCSIMNETRHRTFLKVSISRKRYNREGNTINPEFDYSDWTWVPRNWQERNHPTV